MVAEVTEETFLFFFLHVHVFIRVRAHCGKVSQGVPATSIFPGGDLSHGQVEGSWRHCGLLFALLFFSLGILATFFWSQFKLSLCSRDSDVQLDWIVCWSSGRLKQP